MPSVALITTDPVSLGYEDVDMEIVIDALAHVGIDSEEVIWHQRDTSWADYDLAVIRSPWDYADRAAEFLTWLDEAQALVTVLNPPELVRWNLDKRYMTDLHAAGVTVVPSHFPESLDDVAAALGTMRDAEVVIKPTVSAGSRDTGRFPRGDPAAIELARHIISIGKSVLLQPAVASVASIGERGLVYFDGAFSHAVRKGPILADGGGWLGGAYVEDISAATPSSAEIALGDHAMRAIASIASGLGGGAGTAPPLYARLDLVDMDGRPALLEAELFEPSYFLPTAPGAERRFSEAVAGRIRALGLPT